MSKDRRGGARPNSGPKPKHRKKSTVAFDQDVYEGLISKPNRNNYVNATLRKAMKKEKRNNNEQED